MGKLFFGEMLYDVKGVPNYEIVYLQTEYDNVVSCYYVLQSEYDKYLQIMQNGTYDSYCYMIEQADGYSKMLKLDDAVVDGILNAQHIAAQEALAWDERKDGLYVYRYEENSIFYRWDGELIQTDQGYYWAPNECISNKGGFQSTYQQRISSEYYDAMESLFAYAQRYKQE